MKKTTLLGLINVALILWFLFILTKSYYSFESFVSIESFVKTYSPHVLLLFFLVINVSMIYLLVWKQPKTLSYPLASAVTIAPLLWFIFMYVGIFFSVTPLLPLVSFIFSLLLYRYFKRYSQKVALFLSVGTIIVMLLVMMTSFEESYCWKQGEIADKSATRYIRATKDDAIKLKDFNVTEGEQIGISFRSHMLCHQTFSLTEAVKKSYFFY